MTVKEALQELADMVKEEIIRRLHSSIGINPRTGRNTLIGSNLESSISVLPEGENAIVFSIADYYEYIVSGFRRTGNFPNTWEEFKFNLDRWVTRKNVRIGNLTQSQIVWLLYNKMMFEGRQIAPRPFINSGYNNDEDPSKVLDFLDDFFSRWADKVFQLIMEDVDRYFNE